jgi:hypothetical protein
MTVDSEGYSDIRHNRSRFAASDRRDSQEQLGTCTISGERALQSSALVEATAHLEKAIGLAEGLADGADQLLLRLRLQIAYGNGLIARRGYAVTETTAAFARAQELAAGIEDAAERFSVYFGLWVGRFVRAELEPMRERRNIPARYREPAKVAGSRRRAPSLWLDLLVPG